MSQSLHPALNLERVVPRQDRLYPPDNGPLFADLAPEPPDTEPLEPAPRPEPERPPWAELAEALERQHPECNCEAIGYMVAGQWCGRTWKPGDGSYAAFAAEVAEWLISRPAPAHTEAPYAA